jgi:hypothetical protein
MKRYNVAGRAAMFATIVASSVAVGIPVDLSVILASVIMLGDSRELRRRLELLSRDLRRRLELLFRKRSDGEEQSPPHSM